MHADNIRDHERLRQEAIDLTAAWAGTDPIRGEAAVRAALIAADVPQDELESLLPYVMDAARERGLLRSAEAARRVYTRSERRHVEALLARASHLSERTEGRPELRYDRAELTALRWVLEQVVEAFGPLPADLEQLRVSIWPDGKRPSCPACGARSGNPCLKPNGDPWDQVHEARRSTLRSHAEDARRDQR